MPNSDTITIPDTEDQSSFVEGIEYDVLQSGGGKVLAANIAGQDKQEGLNLAGALLMGLIAWVTRDEAGFPQWSKGKWTEAADKLYAAMRTAGKVSDEDEKRFQTAIRAVWSRSTGSNIRDSFIVLYCRDQLQKGKVLGTSEPTPAMLRNHAAAIKVLGPDLAAMLPEELREGPWYPTSVNADLKRAVAEQLHHHGLTVPEKFGGEPKDGNAKGTKDKVPASVETDLTETATQAISGHVGTDGGSSFESVATGILAVVAAFGSEVVAAGEIHNRAGVAAIIDNAYEVLGITRKSLTEPTKVTEADVKRLAALAPTSDEN